MNYTVKELYYTLQGEGANTGRAAIFLRFAGCNLWSGREADRNRGPSCSRWCDTDFVGTDGPGGGKYETPRELVTRVVNLWPATEGKPFVVLPVGSLYSNSIVLSLRLSIPPGSRSPSRPMAHVSHPRGSIGYASAPRLGQS